MSLESKITKAKLDQAINMLKTKSVEELSGKFDDKSRKEILSKIDEFDAKKLSELKIDPMEFLGKLTPQDIEKVKTIAGKDVDVLMKKLKDITGGKK
ncbi:MAG: hypothetical protein E7388_02970 [Ruminococcaceae bacterium]|nr:hypothetical protein [Oscillospiraceae bacterium]